MKCEAIGANLMQQHVDEKVRMLDAFIDLLEHIEDHPVSRYEFGEDEALGLRCFAGYLACELEELRMGHGSGTLPLVACMEQDVPAITPSCEGLHPRRMR